MSNSVCMSTIISYTMYGKALSVLSWVVQDRHATMGKHIIVALVFTTLVKEVLILLSAHVAVKLLLAT